MYEFTVAAVPISWPHKGDISFDNVSIRYENQQQNVISNLSLTIEAGKRVRTIFYYCFIILYAELICVYLQRLKKNLFVYDLI